MQPHSEPILALDPAMQADPANDSGSDYEYEYDDTETETVYLNLDLTSLTGPIRPPRRRQQSSTDNNNNGNDNNADLDPTATPTSSFLPDNDQSDRDTPAADQVQILGLHTRNPLVSYQNQIFSCSWADQIGTELFFTHPEIGQVLPENADPNAFPPLPSLKHGKDFDLLAANRIKLLGRKATLIPSSGAVGGGGGGPQADSTIIQTPAETPSATPTTTTATGTGTGTGTRRTGPPTTQSRFLERLRSVKQAKGETDQVRTVYSLKRNQQLEERLRGWARTEEQIAEIQRLNELALRGDDNAIAELENLYAQLSGGDAGTLEDPPR